MIKGIKMNLMKSYELVFLPVKSEKVSGVRLLLMYFLR